MARPRRSNYTSRKTDIVVDEPTAREIEASPRRTQFTRPKTTRTDYFGSYDDGRPYDREPDYYNPQRTIRTAVRVQKRKGEPWYQNPRVWNEINQVLSSQRKRGVHAELRVRERKKCENNKAVRRARAFKAMASGRKLSNVFRKHRC